MIINHNLMSMNALGYLNSNNNALQGALQHLSSGKRINSAADDAAGLAISEKMKSQIDGLDQASRNAQDGISLIQTAEGALNETHSILQRMRDLAVQSANDTNTSDDRSALQQEVSQLTQEIDRIANTTQFNSKNLLEGSLGLSSTDGENISQLSMAGNVAAGTISLDNGGAAVTLGTTASVTLSMGSSTSVAASGTLDITVDGSLYKVGVTANESYSDVVKQINSSISGVTASYDSTNGLTIHTNDVGSAQTIKVEEEAANTLSGTADFSGVNAQTDTGSDADVSGLTATDGSRTYTATSIGNNVTLTDSSTGGTISFALVGDASDNTKASIDSKSISVGGALTLQIGANQDQTMSININAMNSSNLGVDHIDISTQQGAESAISSIDAAIKSVSSQRAQLGAYQNRLDHTINNLNTASENLTSASSRITDVDMAKEMADFTKDNVLEQAAVSMLAQANQQPQMVLKLLG